MTKGIKSIGGKAYKKTETTKELTKDVTKLKKTVRHLNKMNKIHQLYNDTGKVVINPTISGIVTYLNPSLSGDAFENTAGMANDELAQLMVQSVDIKGYIQGDTSANILSSQSVRVILFQDKANGQFLPNVTDVLHTADYFSQYNIDTMKRFRILSDKKYDLQAYSQTGGVYSLGGKSFSLKKYFKDCKMEFVGNFGTISSANINQLFMLTIINAGANTPTVTFNSRVKAQSL